jgi:rhodanese-related sulfurtransferase
MFLRKSRPAVGPSAIDGATAVARHGRGDIRLLDVREPGEIRMTGAASGAVTVPLSLLPLRADPRAPDRAPGLDPDMPVAIYCASGGRAWAAADLLARLGYREVHVLGGLRDWAAAGGAVHRPA